MSPILTRQRNALKVRPHFNTFQPPVKTGDTSKWRVNFDTFWRCVETGDTSGIYPSGVVAMDRGQDATPLGLGEMTGA